MKTDDTPGLYWDAYEGTLAPPSGSAARNLAAIRQRLAAGERVSAAPAQPQPAPPRAAAAVLLWWGKSASASVGLGIGALLTVKVAVMGVQALSPTPTGAQPVVAGTPAAAAPVVAPQPRGGPTPESPEAEAVIVDPSGARSPTVQPAAKASVGAARRSPTPTVDRLRAEVVLMDRARESLERGDGHELWRLMDEHSRRFPRGAMTEEREAWRAVAACRIGHRDADARAHRFLAGHPRSAQAGRVTRECIASR